MKRWLSVIVILLISIAVIAYQTKASDRGFFMPESLAGMTIVVDPGHGGLDGGANVGEVVERDITLSISKMLEKELKGRGAVVVMTRTKPGDALAEHQPNDEFPTVRARKMADLKLREDIVNKSKPDVFLSVHVNAIPQERWRGAQVFYHKDGHPDGELLAKSIQASFRDSLGNTDREALGVKQVYLLKKAPVPSVLVETGFISNPEERELLVDEKYQKQVAEAIADGVELYLDGTVQ